MKRVAEDFYDIGLALKRLRRPQSMRALGYKTFAVLCKKEFRMSATKATELIAVSTAMNRDLARLLGHSRAMELVRLTRATPEDDTPAELVGQAFTLPSGQAVDLSTASVREIRRATKAVRDASGTGGAGRTATAAERNLARGLERALWRAGFKRATVKAVAVKSGAAADLRISGVPLIAFGRMGRVLAKGAPVHGRP